MIVVVKMTRKTTCSRTKRIEELRIELYSSKSSYRIGMSNFQLDMLADKLMSLAGSFVGDVFSIGGPTGHI